MIKVGRLTGWTLVDKFRNYMAWRRLELEIQKFYRNLKFNQNNKIFEKRFSELSIFW